MDVSQSEEWSGTMNEFRALVRAKLADNVCVSRASTVEGMLAQSPHLMGNKNPPLF